MKRTHTCGELGIKNLDKKVALCGWVHTRRDHGGIIFIDLRDRYGLTQVVFDPSYNEISHKTAEVLGREDVISVKGIVKKRREGMANPKLHTGSIEVFADELEILSESDIPPIEIDDRVEANEDIRLKYRFLDLRKPGMQHNLAVRHNHGFLEIETPILAKSTPEGARDYLVPSRVHPGKFYALPQSPQIFKQLLMVSGLDRYFQIAKCFRDEDLRADRQPEFTQIDVEMSFIGEEDIYSLIEELLRSIWKEALGKDIKTPFPRMSYDEAIGKYGLDKPDTRFELKLVDATSIVRNSNFQVFTNAVKNGGIVKCINAKGCGSFSRTDIEELTSFVAIYGSKGLAWIKATDKGLESSIVKFLSEDIQKDLAKAADAKGGDLLLFVADQSHKIVNDSLGYLRLELARRLNLIDKSKFNFLWITDFPLLEFNEEEQRYYAMHHPFTSPKDEHIKLLEAHPEKVKAKAYDVVLNGTELGGGSIRIHRSDIQSKVFRALGISEAEAQEKFGFLLGAFRFGAPPHGGIALGLDRLTAILTGNESIREVIAFPKNKSAESLMDECPSDAAEKQLGELHIMLDFVKEGRNAVFEKIKDTLNREKAEFETIEHKAVYTSREAAEVRGTELKQGCKALICKTNEGFIQAVVPGNKELDVKKLQEKTLFKTLELADAKEVKKATDCNIGSVPPFGNLFGLKTYFDKGVLDNDIVAFNAGSHTRSIKMKAKDLARIVNPTIGEFAK
ncbi:aspartate--tRNA ligase [Candidatus Woesearchaeota archaeon]|nr:aspartate--tRNA ligase [Candidatus Woesearchaeota archaeon]